MNLSCIPPGASQCQSHRVSIHQVWRADRRQSIVQSCTSPFVVAHLRQHQQFPQSYMADKPKSLLADCDLSVPPQRVIRTGRAVKRYHTWLGSQARPSVPFFSELWPRPLVIALAHFTQIWIQNLTTSLSQRPTRRVDSSNIDPSMGPRDPALKNLPTTVSWYLAQFNLSSPLVVKLLRCPILESHSSANPNMYSQTRPTAKTSCSASVRYRQSF
jgi:hypothetical protein